MISFILRIIVAVVIALLLAIIGVNGNVAVLQTLFTVLGIVFSISMSLLVSFSLSKILNKKLRNSLRWAIEHTRNQLLLDFGLSTLVLVMALIWDEKHMRYDISSWCIIDIMLIAVTLEATSLIFEIFNFRRLHKLHTDIEDAVIEEEISKVNRQ